MFNLIFELSKSLGFLLICRQAILFEKFDEFSLRLVGVDLEQQFRCPEGFDYAK